ncbi:MAG: LPS export ABC transporter ATP-binding protein [Cyanobacteria bacterium P01_G01_bin.54]
MTIYLQNVQKFYGKRAVVNQVNVEVAPGEIVGLLGPNGAGKTTTFYMATGLVRPTAGAVWLNNREITQLSLDARSHLGIGYLPQQASIFRNLSIEDNLRLVLEQGNLSPDRQAQRLAQLLEEFRLTAVAQTPGRFVSGGERRRTEIARALATGQQGPDYLLLDEPFAGVDPIAVSEIQKLIAALCDRPMGILITDHNVRETLAVIDRAYIMREGEILAAGTAEELYADPLVRKYYLGDDFQI